MARPALAKGKGQPAKPSGAATIIGAVVVTLVAAGGGGILGTMLEQKTDGKNAAVDSAKPAVDAHGKSAEEGTANTPAPGATLKPLPAIVTNLRGENAAWVRVEASLVMPPIPVPDTDRLAAQISEDIVAFLRTLSLPEIEGASGMQHLREDLDDRVRVRSEGVVQDLIVHTLVIE